MKKILFTLFLVVLFFGVIGVVSVYREIFSLDLSGKEIVNFEVKKGESVSAFATRLEDEGLIKDADVLKLYLKLKGLDKKVQFGNFEVTAPITVERIASALGVAHTNERNITIIPGWNLRDIAKYFEREGIASSSEVFAFTGRPAEFGRATSSLEAAFPMLAGKPNVSLEGYLAPETYRIYKNEELESILKRLLSHRQEQFTLEWLQEIERQGHSVHEILTMASILEREVKTLEDRKKVSDLFWRRVNAGWGLQADSTVHYLSGREGDVFTKSEERQIDSLYNTYKYRNLPPGPISNPSVSAIEAAIYPEKNDAWYFLTTFDGEVIYSKTLDEHNANVAKHLR